MTVKNFYNAGEVAVNTMDHVSEFEKKSIFLLRHADKIFDGDDLSDLPPTLLRLFGDKESRCKIIDFFGVFAQYSIRPVVRHQPNCMCVGADENVFSNMLKLSLQGPNNEAMILGSLLVKGQQISNLIRKANFVASLIDRDLKEHAHLRELKTNYHKHLN
tara:strand:- start:75 stop:554 length:480 start_codon:yes stop_codon:yes gene_type:complete